MAVENYPECIYCGKQTVEVGFDKIQKSIIYFCECGEFILVKVEDD